LNEFFKTFEEPLKFRKMLGDSKVSMSFKSSAELSLFFLFFKSFAIKEKVLF